MQRALCKIAVVFWLVATHVIASAAIKAAVIYPQFRYEYIVLTGTLLVIYLYGWLFRIRREKGTANSEPLFKYYWRTRLSKGGF